MTGTKGPSWLVNGRLAHSEFRKHLKKWKVGKKPWMVGGRHEADVYHELLDWITDESLDEKAYLQSEQTRMDGELNFVRSPEAEQRQKSMGRVRRRKKTLGLGCRNSEHQS
jgi:hypothetical protein